MTVARLLGETLRKRRLELGIGLRELAGRVGISPTYLSRVETNDERNPPAETPLRALATALEVDPDLLMRLAGRMSADVEAIVLNDPQMPAFLRTMSQRGLSAADLEAMLAKGDKAKLIRSATGRAGARVRFARPPSMRP